MIKRIILVLLIAILLLVSAPKLAAQEPIIYLPLIYAPYNCSKELEMSDWKIVIPEATTNNVRNPVLGGTARFTAEGAAVVARSSTYQLYELYSLRVQTAANNEGVRFNLNTLANAIHYATIRVRGTLPAVWDWSVDNANYTAPALIETIDANWSLYGLQFPAAQCNGATNFYIHQNGAGAGDFYIDGVQVEEKEYWTTLCWGNQTGCEWTGAEHDTHSTRSASSRAGGRVYDLQTDYDFDIGGMFGLGAKPQTVIMDEYALIPGGELNTIKVHPRSFSLTGVIRGTSYADLHTKASTLQSAIAHDTYPQDDNGWQPVRLRYTGAVAQKEIAAHYEGGLEGNIEATGSCWWQRSPIRFIAEDPYLYPPGGSGTGGTGGAGVLDTNDTATLRYCSGRLRSTGQWDDLGLTNNPTANGTIFTIAVDPTNGDVYVGGQFTGMNNVVGRDYIARYTPSTDTWATVGNNSAFNGIIEAMVFDQGGDLYIAGSFTNVDGIAAADYLVMWDGTNYNAVGVPVAGAAAITTARALAFDRAGNLYIGGVFTDWANIANADYFVMWDGAAYSAVGLNGTNGVYTIAIDANDNIYIGGNFLNWGGVGTADYLAVWDGTSWDDVGGGGGTSDVLDLAISSDNILYLVGDFTNWAGIANADFIAGWNGTTFFALGSGASGGVGVPGIYEIDIAPNGMVYVSGDFDTAGGIDITTNLAKWNGASWAHLDVILPGNPTCYAIVIGSQDPVIPANYDLWLGFTTTGAGYFAGLVTTNNSGTANSYPRIILERSGGTSSTIRNIRNETTGKELLLDYDLLDGESLTIDTRPSQKSVVSSFFGSVPDAILPNSDFGDFFLLPGDNDITCFVDITGATITAWMEWQIPYNGL